MKKSISVLFILSYVFLSGVSQDLKSQSGWIQQQSGVNLTLNSIYFINNSTGWICGDSGKILKTSNGGDNWILQNSPTHYPLLSVFFLNENTGWCSGGTNNFNFFPNRMIVLKTTNGGSDWFTSYFSNSTYTCFSSIYFTDELHGCVVEQGGTGSGSVGDLSISSDGGFNWTSTQTFATSDLQFTDANTGWVLGRYGDDTGHDTSFIKRSSDGGSSWITLYKKSKIHLHSSYFMNNNTGWIKGVDREVSPNVEMLMKTTNGGMNFTRYNLENNIYLNSIFFTDVNNGWGCHGRIYRTANSGLNWQLQLDYISYFYNSIFFTDSLNGWVAGNNGVILSTRTGGINSITSIGENQPNHYSLSQNYPNPFNPVTVIRYLLIENRFTTLKIYNALGKEVATLVNENQNKGNYSVEWDASDLSSGIYFYRISVGEFSEVKKMTLLK